MRDKYHRIWNITDIMIVWPTQFFFLRNQNKQNKIRNLPFILFAIILCTFSEAYASDQIMKLHWWIAFMLWNINVFQSVEFKSPLFDLADLGFCGDLGLGLLALELGLLDLSPGLGDLTCSWLWSRVLLNHVSSCMYLSLISLVKLTVASSDLIAALTSLAFLPCASHWVVSALMVVRSFWSRSGDSESLTCRGCRSWNCSATGMYSGLRLFLCTLSICRLRSSRSAWIISWWPIFSSLYFWRSLRIGVEQRCR